MKNKDYYIKSKCPMALFEQVKGRSPLGPYTDYKAKNNNVNNFKE
ncbi:MAG: hypothetical protein Ta2D_11380 [Rickettsiales bacterium]|nr:MAG: hypothetical protein Ta2D_11380 [Rickettsiales bacterium]